MMIGFMDIKSINLPIGCVAEFYQHFRNAGRKRLEGVALLAGKTAGSTFDVTATIIPLQTSYNIEGGLLYSVDGDELFRINKWLYDNGLQLISQVHSHPGEAYHSDTDDAFPIVATLGGFSIVVPIFGFDTFDLQDWAVFRLLPDRGWVEQEEVSTLIKITG